jgi:hypothetical protein
VELYLPLFKHYALKTYGGIWGSGVHLTLALDESELLTSRPVSFSPGEESAGAYWIGGWVGPRRGLDALEEDLLPLLRLESRLLS